MVEGWFTGKRLKDYLPGPRGTLAHIRPRAGSSMERIAPR